ncbi:MAG TPA: hypothetical protein VLK27_10245 [Chthoniobacterales bacterium]|nr:hypothetical protein [Chthoniobacterales bacterium]
MTDSGIGRKVDHVRLLFKIIAYVAAALGALFALGLGSWPLAYMFPLGLVAVFNRHLANDGGWGVLIGTWLVYVVHGFFYFRSKTTLRTLILFGVLVVLLTCNVAGCRQMWHGH